MSVESEILRIQHNIANTYAAVSEKGGEVPLQPTSANLAAAVASIPVGVTQEELSQALLTKQDKLVGQPGQVVGFNAQGAAQAVQGWSNPNMLDNWYFVDPVNQRGQTEYIGNADPIYTLDRWKLAGLSTRNAKLELVDGGVRITSGNAFCQIVENNVTRALIGKTVTVSALMDIEIPPVAGQLGIVADNEWIGSTPLPATTGTDILVSTTISIGNVSTLIPWIYSAPGGVYKLKAIKLEQGPVQTLAHQDADGNWVLNDPPPNKALELAKCQRYYFDQIINAWLPLCNNSNNLHQLVVTYPATMRVVPATTLLTPDGDTVTSITVAVKYKDCMVLSSNSNATVYRVVADANL